MTGATNVVELHDVSRSYGTLVTAIQHVSLTIGAGEYVAITGPSGSGKSTLLGLLGCLDQATSGTVLIAGQRAEGDAVRTRLRGRCIGFVFQQFHLLDQLTALGNVELALLYRGITSRGRRELAAQVLERVGLGHRMKHRPAQLSGGEQQRVAIARALVTDPPLLLADEPTGNLDTASATVVIDLLERFLDPRRTLILVTHDPVLAARADRRIEIRDGLVINDSRASSQPMTPSRQDGSPRPWT
ncbi:MAG: ABC transporter ATP-binding protein [Actinomycetales bacterium]